MIDVVITAWPNHLARLDCFRRTARSMLQLTASRHQLRFLCSMETEEDRKHDWCGGQLLDICAELGIHWFPRIVGAVQGRVDKPDLGANMNAALRLCTAPTILLVQDDCPLIHPLDLSDAVDLIQNNRHIDLIRFEWPPQPHRTAFTDDDWPPPWRQFELEKRFYGDRPHLRRQDFMARHGWYTEYGPHGSSETDMANRLCKNNAVILAPEKQYFEHIVGPTSVINDTRERMIKR